MAVSKVAVIALVGILAIPILLGFAFNLTETSQTGYKTNGDSVNVTPLLQNGVSYSYSHGDAYKLNTNFGIGGSTSTYSSPIMPVYNSITSAKTNFFIAQNANGSGVPPNLNNLSNYNYNYISITGATRTNYIAFDIIDNNGNALDTTHTVGALVSWYYDDKTKTIHYSTMDTRDGYWGTPQSYSFTKPNNVSYLGVKYYNYGFTGKYIEHWYWKGNTNSWVDFSGGFYFKGTPTWYQILMPEYTISSTITMNLDSITASNYECGFMAGDVRYILVKTTNDGTVSWGLEVRPYNQPVERMDLYYNPSRSDNTYQFVIKTIDTGLKNDNDDSYYDSIIDARYVGGWPKLIGTANYYQSETMTHRVIFDPGTENYIRISDPNGNFADNNFRTPTMRIDDAYFRAFEYPVIESETYTPSDFKNNPLTKIKDIKTYGDSITFAGNTYTVDKDGNITLGNHKIPLNNIELKSVPVAGLYDNMIGNTLISTTSQPSTISFNGKWSASVETFAQEPYTYTKTTWTPGQFAWDGMDTNFLMVGLITCLGVFIALGIYVRKSGKGMIPLLIVCGCCAGLFFCMI